MMGKRERGKKNLGIPTGRKNFAARTDTFSQ